MDILKVPTLPPSRKAIFLPEEGPLPENLSKHLQIAADQAFDDCLYTWYTHLDQTQSQAQMEQI